MMVSKTQASRSTRSKYIPMNVTRKLLSSIIYTYLWSTDDDDDLDIDRELEITKHIREEIIQGKKIRSRKQLKSQSDRNE